MKQKIFDGKNNNMKIKCILYLIILLLFNLSCNLKNNRGTTENKKTLRITGDTDKLLQYDSIFSSIVSIPLETNDKCLISRINKVLFYGDKMFLHDDNQRLLVFNVNGEFLYEIGKKGKGPGEFINFSDFDIDNEGNVYLLDFHKIIKFSTDGTFLKNIKLNFPIGEFRPDQFALNDNGGFYIWDVGRFYPQYKTEKYFMNEVNNEGKSINKYFPAKYNEPSNSHKFKRYKDTVLIDPIFGWNTIYALNSKGLEERYFIDFGKKTMNIPVPEGFIYPTDFKNEIDKSYYHTISGFNETEEWIYFEFITKGRVYNVYYSKVLNKSFISKQWPLSSGHITPWKIDGIFDNNFVALIDPQYVIEEINNCLKMDINKLEGSVKKNLKRLENIKIQDNQVLFICTMKKY